MRFANTFRLSLLVVGTTLTTSNAYADSCPYIAVGDRAMAQYRSYLEQVLKGDCSSVAKVVDALKAHNQAVDNSVKYCKGYY
jgi:hypothetical protein